MLLRKLNVNRLALFIFVGCSCLMFLNIHLLEDLSPEFVYSNYQNLIDLIDDSKCPACFGDSLDCQFIEVEDFVHAHVYIGTLAQERVVAKSIKDEKEKCDIVREMFNGIDNCANPKLYSKLQLESKTDFDFSKLERRLNTCPSKRIYNSLSALDFYTMFFDFSLFINSKAHIFGTQSWFPQVLSRCPQVYVTKHTGKTLRELEKASLIGRYRICYEALILAEEMSKTSEGFVLYMTDASLDNLVWASDGRVLPIDLDDFVAVDSREVKKPKGYYNQPFEDCPNDCISYVPHDLCKYPAGDLNYYTVCKFVVNKLIFYDADEDLLEILEKCVVDGKGRNREQHVRDLKEALLYRLTHTGIPTELNFVTSEIREYK